MSPSQDDLSITDEERLWRRIIPNWLHREPDGKVRPSSHAFIDRRSGNVSVHIASLTDSARVLADYPDYSIAEIEVRLPRSLGYAIVPAPTPADPSHALICPPPGRQAVSKSHARMMARSARWIVLRGRDRG